MGSIQLWLKGKERSKPVSYLYGIGAIIIGIGVLGIFAEGMNHLERGITFGLSFVTGGSIVLGLASLLETFRHMESRLMTDDARDPVETDSSRIE